MQSLVHLVVKKAQQGCCGEWRNKDNGLPCWMNSLILKTWNSFSISLFQMLKRLIPLNNFSKFFVSVSCCAFLRCLGWLYCAKMSLPNVRLWFPMVDSKLSPLFPMMTAVGRWPQVGPMQLPQRSAIPTMALQIIFTCKELVLLPLFPSIISATFNHLKAMP